MAQIRLVRAEYGDVQLFDRARTSIPTLRREIPLDITVSLHVFRSRLVQQVSDAVEGHDRLTGTRCSLDNQDVLRRTDEFVLLCLDRADDASEFATLGLGQDLVQQGIGMVGC